MTSFYLFCRFYIQNQLFMNHCRTKLEKTFESVQKTFYSKKGNYLIHKNVCIKNLHASKHLGLKVGIQFIRRERLRNVERRRPIAYTYIKQHYGFFHWHKQTELTVVEKEKKSNHVRRRGTSQSRETRHFSKRRRSHCLSSLR